MEEKHKETIEKLIAETDCSANFKCLESAAEDLCKAKDWGMEHYVECLDENSSGCKFALSFSKTYCKCPLRVYLAKNPEKQAT